MRRAPAGGMSGLPVRARRACRALFAACTLAAALPVAAAGTERLCLAVIGLPDNKALTAAPLYAEGASFTVTYLHATTRSPVRETYRADATGLTQVEIRFAQPAAGLPTAAGPGETWQREGDQIVVTMARRFDGVRLRVRPEQAPMLDVAGRQTALAQWGDRLIGLVPTACSTGAK
ncbi:MAG: DUF1850 domain-containing protein [Betaproteobacteria bacterium]|jgi:hypothetical protein|nr:DUF1850 domain-containing protein [Betaproteobacteria bacterium]MBK6603094.1 DUF1850 domain-containing protein [Betaproteobacteria bacterium]MBK8687871.1 DUF1850 domain-containing protein [Betaproteobacteria bacterium]